MSENEILPRLFRTEYRKVISVLGKYYGLERLSEAEDIASETFLTAAELWGQKGIPENPVAWLYRVAKNKAQDRLKHLRVVQKNAANIKVDYDEPEEPDLSEQNIFDSQLQMMFAICHPAIPVDAQMALALRVLCGFGIDEIAEAFLTSKDAINKRLFRAKDVLRKGEVHIQFPPQSDIQKRLDTVLTVLYLLFNEGYYSTSPDATIKKELCVEAMRLAYLLGENPATDLPAVKALLALMCFHSSRFDARLDADGHIIRYEDQDPARWNPELIRKGKFYLNGASAGTHISKYHLEATIAYWHTHHEDSFEKWEAILQLYNKLLMMEFSPMAALNRTYALAKARGKEMAIEEAGKLTLTHHHLYHLLMGFLYKEKEPARAILHLEEALGLAKNEMEKNQIRKDIEALRKI